MKRSHNKEANRAARVLLQAAIGQNCLDAVTADIRGLADAIAGLERDSGPWPDLIRQRRLAGNFNRLAPLLADALTAPLAKKFITLLPQFNLLPALPQVCSAYIEACDAHHNITPVQITTAQPVDADMRTRIEAALSERLNTQLRAEYATDPGLIAGFTYSTPDRAGDFSLSGALRQLRHNLISTPLAQPKASS